MMQEQHPNVEFDVEQEYELVWNSESQLNEKVIINTHEQVYYYYYLFIIIINTFFKKVVWRGTICKIVVRN